MAETLYIDAPLVSVYTAPDIEAEPSNQLLYGEQIEILEKSSDWAKIRSAHDGYLGWTLLQNLKKQETKTHKVTSPSTHMYAAPNFKQTPVNTLYFQSQISASEEQESDFMRLENGLWIAAVHTSPLNNTMPDIVKTALQFLGTPYLWGGRSVAGIDCSGLVQISLMAAGLACPRDTHQQKEVIGHAVDHTDLQRGDLVYFKGHVGIMVSGTEILNATARSMDTRIEPLSALVSHYGDILAIRRL